MAKTLEVVRSVAVKVNVGDYQSTDFFASVKAEIVSGDNPQKVGELASRHCASMVLLDLRQHYAARNKKYTDAQICRMHGLHVTKPQGFG